MSSGPAARTVMPSTEVSSIATDKTTAIHDFALAYNFFLVRLIEGATFPFPLALISIPL